MDDMTSRMQPSQQSAGSGADSGAGSGSESGYGYERDFHASLGSGAFQEADRPLEVPGPMGIPVSLDSLPSPDTRRWVVRRKAEVIAAINGGLLTAAEACARYRLSPEELELWQASIDRAGVPGLRVTRIQLYRDYPEPRGFVRPPAPQSLEAATAWAR